MLRENLERELEVLEGMVQAFRGLEKAVIARDTQLVTKYSLNLEELSLEVGRIEDERDRLLAALGHGSVREVIEHSDPIEASALAVLTARIVEKLNELTIVMGHVSELFEFQSHYAKLLHTLLKGSEPSTYSFNPGARGVYGKGEGSSLYDRNF